MKTVIKSFESACKFLGINPHLPDVSMLPEKFQKTVIANYKLDVIQSAINQEADWKADWTNWNQYKYYPWFEWSSSGVGFSYDDCDFVRTGSGVGSRRVFHSSEAARYAGETFIDLYNDAMNIE